MVRRAQTLADAIGLVAEHVPRRRKFPDRAMPYHPMPVPPIYPPVHQPEIRAKFILDVALDGRRDKIIGSWNKMLVIIASLAPGLGNQYAAIGAWGSQLTRSR